MIKDCDNVSDSDKEANPITSFKTAPYRFLSNFYPSVIEYEGHTYKSVEHAYQAAKAVREVDRVQIENADTPGRAKSMGRKIKNKPEWNSIKDDVMLELVSIKFRDPDLAKKLLDTGNAELIEGNTWGDVYWGMVFDPVLETWVGRNKLGQALMKVRANLRDTQVIANADVDTNADAEEN